jgi:hypothetical protein
MPFTSYKPAHSRALNQTNHELNSQYKRLTYQQLAELLDRDQSVIAKHARSAIAEGEVYKESFRQNLPNLWRETRPGS